VNTDQPSTPYSLYEEIRDYAKQTRDDVRRLVTLIDGDDSLGVIGLRQQVAGLRKRMTKIEFWFYTMVVLNIIQFSVNAYLIFWA
jgi:hypothetical protein